MLDEHRDNQTQFLNVLQQIEAHLAALRAESNAVARPWLTVQEAAELLRVSRDTVERMITAGTLKAARVETKLGRGDRSRYRIHRTWIEECLVEHKPSIKNHRQFKRRRGQSARIDFIE